MAQRYNGKNPSSRAKGATQPASRSSGPRKPVDPSAESLSDQPADTSRMLEQLFRVVMEFAERQGVSPQECEEAFIRARRRLTKSPYRMAESNGMDTYYRIGELLTSWHRDADYLDSQGLPKPLRVDDKPFVALSQRYLPNYRPQEVASFMVQENLMEEVGRHVKPRQRGALLGCPNALMLDRIPALVQGLMSTLAHNLGLDAEVHGPRCQRGTNIARLPLKLVPSFNLHVQQLAQTLLDSSESWAQQRELPEGFDPGEQTARVGVEVFFYTENNFVGHESPE